MSSGFQSYGLPTQTCVIRPTLTWNPGHALSLAKLDATYSATNKFAICMGSESSGLHLGDLCSPRGQSRFPPPPALEPFVGQGSMIIFSYWRKTEPLVCAALEAQEHTIQLLEALGSIPAAGSMGPRVSALLTGLSSCTAFPTWEALYKQLRNMRLLRRESMLRSAGNRDTPTQKILRQASSPKEKQFDAAVVDQVSALAQTRSHQNTVSGLCTLVSSNLAPRPTQQPSGLSAGSGRGGARGHGPKGRKSPSKPSFPEPVRRFRPWWRTWPWTKRT